MSESQLKNVDKFIQLIYNNQQIQNILKNLNKEVG